MERKDGTQYNHNDARRLFRWTTRESFQFMSSRSWHRVSDFYLDLVCCGGHSLMRSLLRSSQKNSLNDVLEYSEGDDEMKILNLPIEKRNGRLERKTFKIVISYHGGSFDGWQKQPGLNTVQGLIEKCLGEFVDVKKAHRLKEKSLPVEGLVVVAGRTDRGVTALQQVCSFYTWREDVKCDDLKTAIDAASPEKLRVLHISEVSRTFHPNFTAKWRRYFYIFPLDYSCQIQFDDTNVNYLSCKDEDGECSFLIDENNHADIAEIQTKPLSFNVDKVDQLLRRLEGRPLSYRVFARDTKPSRSSGPPTECYIFHARAAEAKLPCIDKDSMEEVKVMCVELVANRFLRKMVRVLVATAIREAAAGADADSLINLMNAPCRRATAPPAPPDGLCLVDVGYADFVQENSLIL